VAITRRRQSIAVRLYTVGALSLVAVAALAAASIYFAMQTRRAADGLYQGGVVSAVEAGEIELLLEKHRRIIEAAPLEFDRAQIARDKKIDGEVRAHVEALLRRSEPGFSRSVSETLPVLWRHGTEVLRLAENFAQEPALAIVKAYVNEAGRLQERIRQYRAARVTVAKHDAQMLASGARTLVRSVTVSALVASLLIGSFAFILLRGMMSRLERITAAMRRLAQRDTDVSVEDMTSADEIGDMAKAVAIFRENAVHLQELNRWLDIALNNMARGLSMFDVEHRLLVCNETYARMYDLPDDLCRPGARFADIVAHRQAQIEAVEGREGDGEAGFAPALMDLIGQRCEGLVRQNLKDGRTIEMSVKPLAWGGWLALHEDVTERFAAAEKIIRLARQDALTGLANRLQFREALDAATAEVAEGAAFGLLAIDLDRFKEVNDTLGHPAGDALLTAVGTRLMELTRRDDLVARLGGDEFAIIQSGARSKTDSEALARRVIEALHQPFQIHGKRVEIGGTVGIALAPRDGNTAEEILRNADLALYRAKGERRGTWRFFDPEMEGRLRARRALEADLGQAIAHGELELYYQPIVSLATGRVSGCEALIRWRHAARGMIPPSDFIPLAEETGLICDIGAWALEEACSAAASWPGHLKVAVNLSVAQFEGPDLAVIAAKALERSGLTAARLVLEVTETLLLGDDPATLELLHRLRGLGLAIALDDFGTGYSSLSHLRSFPFDTIKIDQSFVRDLPQRKNCEAIVGAVTRLASSLEMTTVAEGVETAEHLARLRAAGCDAVQGYLFSRPVPGAQIIDVIADIDQRLATGVVRAA